MTRASGRLLFLGQALPYPPDSGVSIRAYNVLRLLASRYDVDALFFWRRRSTADGPSIRDRVAALERFASVQVFRIPQEASRARLLADHARSLIGGRPYTHHAYDSAPFAEALDGLLGDRRYDLVHVDSLDLVRYLPRLPPERTVCTHHNVESELLARRAIRERNPAKRALMRHQSRLLRATEREWCPRVALNVAVSEADADALRALAPGSEVAVVPNAVDTDHYRPGADPEEEIVFVGGTSWFPNRDALSWFATDILPLLRGAAEAPVSWVGRATPEERARHAELGITMTGYVDDVRPYLARAACFVVPIRVGGGTRLKVLDAWAMGKAVVSTSAGCEGLEAEHGRNVLIADDPPAFAHAVRRVLEDGSLRRRLGAAARDTVTRRYSWKAVGADMFEAYERIAGGRDSELAGARP